MRYSKQEIASEFIDALGKIKLEESVSNDFTILKSKIKLFNNEVVLKTTYTQTHIPNSKVNCDKLIADSRLLVSKSYIYIIATSE